MVMERRAQRNPNASNNGRHVKKRFRRIRGMSRKALVRLTIALYMLASFTAGAIVELLIDRLS